MLSPITFALLAVLAPFQELAPGIVRGQIRSEASAAPVPGARVELVGVPGVVAVADGAGRYVLAGVPPGRRIIRASHIDHDELQVEVQVPAGGEFLLDFVLEVRPVALPAVTASVLAVRGARDTVAVAAPELGQASIRALEATPGLAELGIAEAAKQLPTGEPLPSEILYVRGAAADLKFILLDGAPVYAPYHLAGLIRPFEDGIVQSATMHAGGAPARFDGGLSYILELQTRAPRLGGTHVSGSVDLLSAEALAEGPATSRVRYLAEARALHGLGMEYLLSGGSPYGYADALVRVDADAGGYGTVSVTGFWNRESVELDGDAEGPAMVPASWGNTAASARYRTTMLGAETELTAGYGIFGATMPLGEERPIVAQGQSRRARLSVDLAGELGRASLHFGVTHDRLELDQRLERSGVPAGSLIDALREVTRGEVTGAYVDASVTPVKRLVLRGGLRADVFSLEPGMRLAPRLAATWLATERLVVRLTTGVYRQYVSIPEPVDEGFVRASSSAARTPLVVARASHLTLGLDREMGHGVRLGLESFVKHFEGLPSGIAPVLPGEPPGSDSEMRTSGVDIWLRRSSGRVQGWVGYSVAWVWADEDSYALTHAVDGRQLVSAGLSGPIGPGGEFEVRFGYGAGLPYTAIPEVVAPEPSLAADAFPIAFPIAFTTAESERPRRGRRPDQPYLRLDAQVSHTWTTRLRGTDVSVTPFLRVLNALDRRDALFYRYDDENGGLQPVGVLPVVPVLGVAWSF